MDYNRLAVLLAALAASESSWPGLHGEVFVHV